jgi:iron complex outermembrane recepter protein
MFDRQTLSAWSLAVLLACTVPATLAAQESGSSGAIRLDEITVVGEKIDRDIQKTTSSVGVVTETQIEESEIRSLPEAFHLLGNVRDADFLDSGYVIRGINSEGVGGPSGRPLATLYIDGVAQTQFGGSRRGALGLWDVEQIEVLRGPQSTISGRNALAGAIQIRTKNPTYYWEGGARITGGTGLDRDYAFEHPQYDLGGVISGPLIADQLAFRLAAELRHADGMIDYPRYQGFPRLEERQDDDAHQIRAKLLFEPRALPGLELSLSYSYSYDSPAYSDVDGPSAGVDYFDRVFGLQRPAEDVEARSTKVHSTAFQAIYSLSDQLLLTALTTYVETRTDRPSVDLAVDGVIDEREIAQEVRLQYATETLTAVIGAYYNHTELENNRDRRPSGEDATQRDRSDTEIDNYAVFGELNWRFRPRWTLILGARYDYEEQAFRSRQQRLLTETGEELSASDSESDVDYDAFLPKAGVVFDVADNQSLGFTVQRAYRAGGSGINFVTGEPFTFDPEYAWNFELAYRSTWADDRVRLNANVFYLDWRDQQIEYPQIPGDINSNITVNAGESHVVGGELEVQALALPSLRVFGSIGVSKTEFDDFRLVQMGQDLDLAGEPFPQAPIWSFAVGAQYDHDLGVFLGGDLKHTGEALSRSLLEGGPRDILDAYTVVNARIGYQAEFWRATLWADNLFDEKYFLYRFDTEPFQIATVGSGRVIGLTLQANF